MKRIIFLVAAALMMATGCNGQNNTNDSNNNAIKQSNNKNMSKTIVIFFSHAGDNYSVGNIEVGNTKIVADYITEITGAAQYRSSPTSTTAWPTRR